MTLGNSHDIDDEWRWGYLVTTGYNNQWNVSEEYIGEQPLRDGEDSIRMVRFLRRSRYH